MDLYDVKARGFHSPLNAREIGQLFRTGQLGGQQPCKPKGEAKWRTVDELFPLLKYEAAAGPLRFKKPAVSNKPIVVFAWTLAGLVLCGIAYFISAPRSTSPTRGHALVESPTLDRRSSGRRETDPSPHPGAAGNQTASSNMERGLEEKQRQEQTAREGQAVRN
jgi:hypothetical protein